MKYKVGDFVKFIYPSDKAVYYGIVTKAYRNETMLVHWLHDHYTNGWSQNDSCFSLVGSK
jgi:hypothetical protein